MISILTQQRKKATYNRVPIYFVIYFLLLQLIIAFFKPDQIIYNYRLNYDLVKNRTSNIEAVLAEVKDTIEKEDLEDYVIILGDSVAYSSPGPANTSIGYYLNDRALKEGFHFKVFNLSMPSMQIGDVYTMMLKMDEYGISRNHLIIDILYSGFLNRQAYSRVFWLSDQLKDLNPLVFEEEKLEIADPEPNSHYVERMLEPLKDMLYENVPLFMYKDYLQAYGKEFLHHLQDKVSAESTVLSWTEKPFLKDLLKEYQYQISFRSDPFVMDEGNPQIRFLNRIIELQQDKNTLIFLAPINEALAADLIDREKYHKNIGLIDAYFSDQPVDYNNYYGQIPMDYFSDHVHYTAEGYQYLSDLLWNEIREWNLQ